MTEIAIRMPEVDIVPRIEKKFIEARRLSAGTTRPVGQGSEQRYIAIVTPGRIVLGQPCPPPGSMPENITLAIEEILPAAVRRNVAAIAFTEILSGISDQQQLTSRLAAAIPFLGFLLGFGYAGHAVTIFEGHPSALIAGLYDTHVLVVDDRMIPHLQRDWIEVAYDVMHTPRIFMFSSADGQIKQIVKQQAK